MATARLVPGIAAAAAAAVLAWLAHLLAPAVPALTVAVVLGIAAANFPATARHVGGVLGPGLRFAATKFMRLGIVLLGLKLSIVDVLGLGWPVLAAVVGILVITFCGTYGMGRALRLPGRQPLLMAAGFSICGASAIGAMSAATGATRREAAAPVAMVTLCGTLAILVLPVAGTLLGLAPEDFGFWAGASVHDVGQVVATAQTAGTAALAAAVVVKLTRVLMLAPMVLAVSAAGRLRSRRAGPAGEAKLPPAVPLFVAGFLGAVGLRSLGVLDAGTLETAGHVQDWLLTLALFGLGTGVRARDFTGKGSRIVVLAVVSWILVAGLSLLALLAL
ncbi:membrane protein [Zafaria cholistanensis]|uniref:Membrane protein n=1 Tax=Zafaria cholistanensis TaxID=1682741 RepID=A0A5A7NPX4_9MICC|nr:putative sulfate exporter family transporter [Zafaria cholistanensis]GER22795.1 membrane protein [Zafaria cholistanensis]